ncbi:MAG: hypothetical protein ABIW81_08300 [Terrimesophilobacter sp.]
MTAATHELAPATVSIFKRDPAWQAFALLRTVFTIAPILFGLDKFFNILTDWPNYLTHIVTDILPISGQQFMYAVGVVEIIAGIAVLVTPKWGSLLVAAWLAGIIVNLLLLPGFFDVALRDFGLFVAALALSRLAWSPAAVSQRSKG